MSDAKDLVSEATAKLHTEADRIRSEITAKEQQLATELADARAQLHELEGAIARIEGKPARAPHGSPRAPRGHNQNGILDALESRPGMTGAEIGEAAGISRNTVFATLARLEHNGLVRKKKTPRGVEHYLR